MIDLNFEQQVALSPLNTFGIQARAQQLLRIGSAEQLRALLNAPEYFTPATPRFILGGGSNIIITGDIKALVLKVEIKGLQLAQETATHWIVQAGAGEPWHGLVAWCMQHGYHGLENMALIPGTVGAAPVQNIGAYGVELKDRLHSLDCTDLTTGRSSTLWPEQCNFGYRDSVFKQALAGKSLITHVRFALPKTWQPVLGYQDLERKMAQTGVSQPSAHHVFDWVVEIRRTKLPDPAVIGNVGSFFKNPTVTEAQARDITGRYPHIVQYPMPDGQVKLAAGWMIDSCGWKGKSVGNAAVYEKQALVLVNKGGAANPATGGEVVTLARAIQASVYEKFGIRLEPEPVVV